MLTWSKYQLTSVEGAFAGRKITRARDLHMTFEYQEYLIHWNRSFLQDNFLVCILSSQSPLRQVAELLSSQAIKDRKAQQTLFVFF